MLKWIIGIIGGLIWSVLVFVAVFWATFPSSALVDRLAYEVQKSTDGQYALRAGSAGLWGAGLSLSNVTMYQLNEEQIAVPMLRAESVSASTSLLSAFGTTHPVSATIDLGQDVVQIDALIDREMPSALSELDIDAPAIPVSALSDLLRPLGMDLKGSGSLAVDLDAELGEKVADYDARLRVETPGMTLGITVPVPGLGDLELNDISVSEIDLVLDVSNGKAKVKRGRIVTSMVEIELDLDTQLKSPLENSRLRGSAVLSGLSFPEEFKSAQSFAESAMANAKWDDGKYHYRVSCAMRRLDASCFRPDRQRKRGGIKANLPDRDRLDRMRDAEAGREPPSADEREAAQRPDRRRPGGSRTNAPDRDSGDDDLDERDDELDERDDDEEGDEELRIDEEPAAQPIDMIAPPPGIELQPLAPAGVEELLIEPPR